MAGHKRRLIYDWVDERIALTTVFDFLRQQLAKPLPKHVNWLFSFGAITLFFFLIQVASGLLLMLYYEASDGLAYNSVKFITETVPFGWFVRQTHAYSANFMIAFLLLHAVRVFIYGGYKKPREITWFFGMGLLAVTMAFGFTGYLLPWDQVSYWGTVVGTEVVGAIPVVGERVLITIRGGEIVSGLTLKRFFAAHVVVLPWAFVALVGTHLFLVRYQGISTLKRTDSDDGETPDQDGEEGQAFYPQHVLTEAISILLVFAAMILVLVYEPLPVHEPADPFNTPAGVKPEWYFLPVYQAMKYVPELTGILGCGAVLLILFFLPLLDRSAERHPARRPLAVTLGLGFVVMAVLLGVLGHLSDTDQIILGSTYHFDVYGFPQLIVAP